MKLNKVLALALSGVMAVSMLAGCSGNPGNGGQGGEEPPVTDTTIAADLNEAQEDYEVKTPFTYDSNLENAMKKVLEVDPSTNANTMAKRLVTVLDLDADTPLNSFYGYDNTVGSQKGEQTEVHVIMDKSGKSEDALVKEMIKALEELSKMKAERTEGNVKYSYSYTGDVAMTQVENNGKVCNYIAVVVTCTTTSALAD